VANERRIQHFDKLRDTVMERFNATTPPDFSRAIRNPALIEAALALQDNRLHDAEPILKAHLKRDPFDVAAIRMLAELAGRIGRYKDSENLLRRAVELAPSFKAARSNLALVLYRQGQAAEAIAELDLLLDDDPDDLSNFNLKAAASSRIGDYAEAVALYEVVLKAQPLQEKIWMSYGHVLKTVGRPADSIAAYRQALSLKPSFGEVWWSLANIKTAPFSDDDLTAMLAQLSHSDLKDDDRFHIDFALGKAFEDRRDWPNAFHHYDAGNNLRRKSLDYDADEQSRQVAHQLKILTPTFFAARPGGGCPAPDPIFVLGMPRAGSTLIEQILSCHSMVEGTQELQDIGKIAQQLGRQGSALEALAKLSTDERQSLGETYLARTQINRKSEKPFFIDKMPNNWLNIGLIHLILPNAKIIDARRHPLDCCFSNFRQHFARGQAFSYGLADAGRYYVDYVKLMKGIDQVLPGRVHRVIHERLVENTDAEVRAMLDYLGLPFEEECLRFWQSDRAVQTPSAEQVRRPINRDGMDRWQAYEQWLDPLKAALGDVLAAYPEVL
jgi:tetratricopeptide (TPR) repeat protein